MKQALFPLILFGLFCGFSSQAQRDFYQKYTFTQADTLRGMLRPERTSFDVTFYDLDILIDPAKRALSGKLTIQLTAAEDFERMQLDLFENLTVKSISMDGMSLPFSRVAQALFVDMPLIRKGKSASIVVEYEGQPLAAKNAPWDGGFVWSQDRNGKPWVGVACEGDGASLWWPNKDHLSDEPDSMMIRLTVPDSLMVVANGELQGQFPAERAGYVRYDWKVSYPINNYNVTVNIGDYRHLQDIYTAADGDRLALDYYVLSYNAEKATEHFQQVHEILSCYEKRFGKYPFWEDGFALVETPYLGMEHQGAIAYGNGYQRGYKGGMIPRDMNWDYILVHEIGHEYFGNSLSIGDMAEMWIHESFTTYAEALYVECTAGYEAYLRYLYHFRNSLYITNEQPIIGPLNVNWDDWEGSDHYFKGSWVLHTLRHLIADDALWFDLLYDLHQSNRISIVTTPEIIDFINRKTKKDWTLFFEQYLYHTDIPVLLYRVKPIEGGIEIHHRLKADVEGLEMPIRVEIGGEEVVLDATTGQRRVETVLGAQAADLRIMRELYLIEEYRVD